MCILVKSTLKRLIYFTSLLVEASRSEHGGTPGRGLRTTHFDRMSNTQSTIWVIYSS